MTETEYDLMTVHLPLVKSLAFYYANNQGYGVGLEYDDLYQVGCIALWQAVLNYRPERGASFKTFARTVVRHKLQDYCEHFNYIQSRLCYLEAPCHEDGSCYLDLIPTPEDPGITEDKILELLDEAKGSYRGIAKKGIEALELKCRGYSNLEIAELYKVKPNHVAAWISRARNRLKTDYRLEELRCS